MLPAEFEPTIPASKRPYADALGRAAMGIGILTLGEDVRDTDSVVKCTEKS
jgi:hypothetical protein